MRRALELAELGRCGASPNPMVGAIVVDLLGDCVGEGHHAVFGGPHAEIEALRAAGDRSVGSTLYVTLEPCCHHGKTPPCAQAILEAGVARVVVASRDPNPAAAGGVELLRESGLAVTVGVEADAARGLNRRWMTWAEQRRPWITLKAAVSLDGRTATRTGDSRWITGKAARHRSLELREEHDAILVGVGTVLADDPRLTRRLGLNPGGPWRRVVLDSRLRTPSTARIVCDRPESTLIVHTQAASERDRSRLSATGVGLMEVAAGEEGRTDLAVLLARLAEVPVAALLVEGGAAVHGAFVDAGFVDETVFFVASMVIGGRNAVPAVAGEGAETLAGALRISLEKVTRHGDDMEISGVCLRDADVHRVD